MKHDTDIIIVGAGLVGSVMAAALGHAGFRVSVFDIAPRERELSSAHDGRASAIAESSVRVYHHVGVWDTLAPHAEPIRDIRVVDGFSRAIVHYDSRRIEDKPEKDRCFGYIIPNTAIKPALIRHAEATEGVTLHFESEILGIETDSGSVTVTLKDKTTHRAALLLAADGRFSKTREMVGIGVRRVTYDQTALVTVISHEKPHHGLALERFLPAGPFAALPMTDNRSGIVWTESHSMAAHMLKLSDSAFTEELAWRLGDEPGKVTLAAPRFSYPLGLLLADSYTVPRIALIGDAAHAIHPIAGQGVNLGYRDVAVLAELLGEARKLGFDPGDASILERYERRRRLDVLSMAAATDGLNRLFSNNVFPIRLARRLGMRVVERFSPVKRYFMLHAMGLTGDLPEMLKDAA